MSRLVDIAVLPSEAVEMEADCYVVVDVLRATTTIATIFAAGLADLVVAQTEELARQIARRDGRLLCGEVGGVAPPGFDYGNSPLELRSAELRGRAAVLFTTNGTGAFCAVAGKAPVLSGALANLSAVAQVASDYERVVIICAGNAGGKRFALEDFVTATEIAGAVLARSPGADAGDAAGLGLEASGYENWIAVSLPQQTARSARALRASAHGRRISEIGFAADVHFAAQRDTADVAPAVVEWGEGWTRLEAGRQVSS